MKTLKIEHKTAHDILSGNRNSTWRLFDDKDLAVGDRVELIDKVDPSARDSWQSIGVAVIEEITTKVLGAVTKEDLSKEGFGTPEAMYKVYRSYYGGKVDKDDIVKIIYFRFEPYAEPRLSASGPVQVEEVKLFADGGSRGNPGPSASGFVIFDMEDNVIEKNGVYLGVTTNNQAEYQAVRFGLEAVRSHGARIVHIYLDSLLVVNQMKGIFKVRNRDLWPIHQSIKELAGSFKKVNYTHVPREYNKEADAMVNETLDAAVKN